MKFDTQKLFVACRVYDLEVEIEPWVQYESFGLVEHNIIVEPKRILVRKDENGSIVDCKTDQKLTVKDYSSSFESESSCLTSLCLSSWPLGSLSHLRKEYYEDKKGEIQFLIPFDEFIKAKLGIEIKQITIAQAQTILKLINLTEGKPFKLSFDEEEAKEQIETRIFNRSKTKSLK